MCSLLDIEACPSRATVLLATLSAGNPWMQELVLLHAPSRSLLVTDLAFNFSKRGRGGGYGG